MANIVVVDGGNSVIKGKTASAEESFPHAIKELMPQAYDQAMMRGGEQIDDYVLVNGIPYAIGKRAFSEGFNGRQHGSARYTKSYYGVFVAAMIGRLYRKSINRIVFYGSHAPQDVEWRDDLKDAVIGYWQVECAGSQHEFEIVDAHCFDEPVGGLMNVVLNEEGTGYHKNGRDLRRGRTLVIDIGGHTTDIVVMEDGKVIYTSAESTEAGVIQVEKDFTRALISQYRNNFKNANAPSPERIREAIRTGKYKAGGYGELPCEDIVDRAANLLMATVHDLFIHHGGVAGNENLLLTGGGSGLLRRKIEEQLGHPNTILATEDASEIHFANVRGGMKMMRFYESKGILNNA